MSRPACASAALLSALVLAAPLPAAQAAGVLVQGDGSFLGGPVEAAALARVRALLVQQGDFVTAVVQAAVADGETIGSAWLLPIAGPLEQAPVAADPALLDELLRLSDPIYDRTGGCGGSGCADSVGDTGVLSAVRFFDETKASSNWTHFGPSAVEAAIQSLASSGFAISDELATDMLAHGSEGGSFLLVRFTGDAPGSASPAVVARYRASELMLPQALTAYTASGEVQTAVLTLTDGPTSPASKAWTTPTLGVPLYEPEATSSFYQARVRYALEELNDDGWILEYSNTLDTLEARSEYLIDDSILWDGDPSVPWSGLNALVRKGLLDDFSPYDLWLTRWRTFQSPALLTDQAFVPDSSVPAYEVYVTADQYGAAAWLITMPVFALGWAMRRREDREPSDS